MKEKIFQLSNKILSWFSISAVTRWKLSNWANLLFLTLKDGGRFSIRSKETHEVSLDFVRYYLFQEKTSEKVSKLKRGLDEESKKMVDEILKRQEYIYPQSFGRPCDF